MTTLKQSMKKLWPLAMLSLGLVLTFILSAESFGQQKPLSPLEGSASQSSTGQKVNLSYVTNPSGTGYYTIAVAQGQLLSRKSNVTVKTLNENYQEMVSIHNDLRRWSPERAVKPLPMPYHPGAIRYYKEKALWNDQMEASQGKLMKQ